MNIINETKKIGLWGGILLVISQVVGIGEFLKNLSIFGNNNNNPYGVIGSWVIGAILIICVGLTIAKLTTQNQKEYNNEGISKWINTIIGPRTARFTAHIMNSIFYPMITIAFCFFGAETIFLLCAPKVHIYWVILTALGILLLFLVLNFFFENIMAKSGHIIGYIKFLPIVLCIVGAIAITIKGNPDNLFSKDSSSAGKFTTLGMLDSLPAVLFSFNGFLIAGDMGHKMKDPDKNVGKAIVFSMLVIAGIYLTVAVTLAIVGATGGNALKVLDGVLGSDTGQKIMTALLLIVILGSTCLLTMVSYQTVKKHVKNEDMPLYAQITKINNKRANLGDVVATAIVIMIWAVLLFVPSAILNTDSVIDVASNTVSLIVFVLCGIIITKLCYNIIKDKTNSLGWKSNIIAFISAIALIASIGYFSLWAEIAAPIINPTDPTHAGLFMSNNGFNLSVEAGIYWGCMLVLLCLPFLWDLIIKYTQKGYRKPLIWSTIK